MQSEVFDPLLGQLIAGRYRVIRPLGEGGMGHVYLAMHEAIEKRIALKVLKPEYSAKEDIVTRFQQEAISASRIKHPNVLEVFDFGKLDNGCAFLAMEFLSGNDLADELQRHGVLQTRRALRITLQICRALASAHKAHVVHRDMKPDNVFLLRTEDGEEIVKIVDFGIAQLRSPEDEAKSAPTRRRLTKTGMIFGTPEYMAPEQAAGKKADQRVDVYAVGIILFEMLTGAVPFTGDSFMAVLAAHLHDPAPSMLQFRPDLDVSPELHAVVQRALSKSPDERFFSMADFAAAVLATREGLSLQAAGEVTPGSLPPPPLTGGVVPAHPTRPQGSGRDSDPAYASQQRLAPPGTRGGTSVVDPKVLGQPPTMASVAAVSADRPGTLDAAATADQGREPPTRRGGTGITVAALLGAAGVAAVALFVWPKLATEAGSAATAGGLAETLPASGPELGLGAGVVAVPSAAPTPTAPAVATVVEVPTVAPSATAPSVEPVKMVDANLVTITVESKPPGARVEKDGFQVCDATPCEVRVEPGVGIQFEATLGALRGSAKVEPQSDQRVTITLKGQAARPKSTGPTMCEVTVGGLKILRECPK